MARPDLVEVEEPIIHPEGPPPTRVWQLESALQQLEQGNWSQAALLGDAMMRNDRIAACFETRINGVLGAELKLEPGKDTARGRKIAADLEGNWGDMFDVSVLAELMRYGLMDNGAPTENLWIRSSGYWDVRLKVWHPHLLYFNGQEHQYYVTDLKGRSIPLTTGDGKWGLFCPFGSDRAWLGALVRSLAHPYLMQAWGRRDAARWCEVNGLPLAIISHPSGDEKQAKRLQASFFKRGAETSLLAPQTKDGVGYGVTYLEASGSGIDGIMQMIAHSEKSSTIRILGQSMSTEGQNGLGSQQKGGDSVRNDIKRADAERLGDFLRRNVLRPWALYNYGDPDLAPFVRYQVQPPEDTSAMAVEFKAWSEGLLNFKTLGSFAPLDVRTKLETLGMPLLTLAQVEALKAEEDATPEPQAPTIGENGADPNKVDALSQGE